MPLDKSMSMGTIIKKEIASGKPNKQAVAIAYSVKSKAKPSKLGVSRRTDFGGRKTSGGY